MDSSSEVNTELLTRILQQEVVAELGQQALEGGDVDQLMHDAAEAVADTLDNEYCKVLELLPGGDEVFLRQGVGWQDGYVGNATVPTDLDSQAGYTLISEEPIIVDDLGTESRFSGPDLLVDHDVISGISVIIGSVEEPWGVLGTHTTEHREFTDDDATFVQNVANVLAAAIDRTEKDTQLREREARLERYKEYTGRVLDAIDDVFYILDENGNLRRWNESLCEVTGNTGAEIESMHAPDLFDEATEDVADRIDEAFETGSTRVQADVLTSDGESVPYEFAGATLDDSEGNPVLVGIGRDITERKAREQELAKYEAIIETINDGIYVIDEDDRFTIVNEAYTELTGYAREELLGEHASLVVDEDMLDQATQLRQAMADGEVANPTLEGTIQTAGGDRVPVEATFAALPTSGERKRIGVVRDVTERKEQRRKLEESERRYRTLVEHFPNGAVGLFDENLEYTAVGGQLMDAADVAPEDRVGSSVYDIYPDEIVEEIEPYFHAALEGEANSFEAEYHDRYLFAHTLPIRNGDDEAFAGMLVVQDITDQKRVEKELRESEAKFRMLAENLEEIVWMTTADAEEFIYLNPAFEEVWGLDRESLYDDPLSFLDAVHEDDRERVRKAFSALPEDEFDDEFRIVRPDGEVRWVHARGNRVADEDGEMVPIVGIGEDITEQVEREAELERVLDLLEKTERIADVGGWEIDPKTQDVFWTDHIFDVLEVASDEEPPLDEALDMYHEDDQPVVESAVENALDSGDPFDVEVRLRTGSGEVRWLRLQGAPETVDDEVVSFRGAAQDVTERKQREQRLEELVERLEESNERLEQFAYAASHDLQEPLRMVSSYLQLIESRYADELDEDGEEFIDFAVDGADRMRDMIDGLLKYSRVDTQGDPFEPVDLASVIEDVRENLQVKIEERDGEITVDSLPDVEGDRGQLRQVFQNLLSNAIEYSGDDPPRVHASAERADERWVISVRDEGIGIDPDDQERIFEVFQSLHAPADHSGTGIGLALCERIVERHGGDIWVESEPGEGATFSFALPATRETERDRDE
jgi:PAS domain S-box-containing protein